MSKKCLYVGYFNAISIQLMVLHCKENEGNYSVLLTCSDAGDKNILQSIFSKVEYKANCVPEKVHFNQREEQIKSTIIDSYDKVFSEIGITIDGFDKIYVGCDMRNDFAIYCALKKVNYYFVECYYGQLNLDRFKVYEWHIKNANPHGSIAYFNVSKKYKSLCGNSEYVIKKIIQSQSLDMGYKYDNYIVYDYNQAILSLSKSIKTLLVECFDSDGSVRVSCRKANNSAMVLTQRQWLYPVSNDETGVLYQYLVDYVLDKYGRDISIKPHPSDKYNHHHFFENAVIFPVKFPAELFPAIDGFEISCALTVSSTSIQKFSAWCNNLIQVGTVYFEIWRNINKLFFSCKVAKYLFDSRVPLYRRGTLGEDAYEFMRKCSGLSFAGIPKSVCDFGHVNGVCFVDKLNLAYDSDFNKYFNDILDLNDSTVIIFMDFDNKLDFIDIDHLSLLKNIVTVKLSKFDIRDDIYADLTPEYIYIYSKNRSLLNKLLTYQEVKTLQNTGINIKAEIDKANSHIIDVLFNK